MLVSERARRERARASAGEVGNGWAKRQLARRANSKTNGKRWCEQTEPGATDLAERVGGINVDGIALPTVSTGSKCRSSSLRIQRDKHRDQRQEQDYHTTNQENKTPDHERAKERESRSR